MILGNKEYGLRKLIQFYNMDILKVEIWRSKGIVYMVWKIYVVFIYVVIQFRSLFFYLY